MSESLVAVPQWATLRAAAGVMRGSHIGLLMVTGDDDQELVGVIGERDIVTSVADRDDLDAVMAADRARSDIVTVPHDASLHRCMEMMMEAGVRHLVVLGDDGHPVGVISARDIISEMTQA